MSRHWSETRLTKHPSSTPAPATSAAGEWKIVYLGESIGFVLNDGSDHELVVVDTNLSYRDAEKLRDAHKVSLADGWAKCSEQLATAQKEASEALAAVGLKDEALEAAKFALEWLCGWIGDSGNDRTKAVYDQAHSKVEAALAIQPDSSALNTVIEAATAKLRDALEALDDLPWIHAPDCDHCSREDDSDCSCGTTKRYRAFAAILKPALTAARNLSGSLSGQTAGVASEKAGQP